MKHRPHSPPSRSRVIWGGSLFVIWLAGSTLAIYLFTFKDYGEFDQRQQWLGWQAPESIAGALGIDSRDEVTTLVTVKEPGCSCNNYLNTHLNQINFAHSITRSLEVAPSFIREAGFVVPATPMAMVFYGDELIYAGPFATGPFCAAQDSLLVDLLQRQQTLAGTFLNGLVKACRCTEQS